MTGRLLTYGQAADLLGVSSKTIGRRVKARAFPVVVDGGIRRIPADALNAYVGGRTVPARENHARASKRVTTARGRVSGDTRGSQPTGSVRRLWEDAEPNETAP
jgi:excisionase family DNA binding protein